MPEGTGIIVEAFPEAVQAKLVTVSVPGTVEERASCAVAPEHMVTGDGTDVLTLGIGFTITVALPETDPEEQTWFETETRV